MHVSGLRQHKLQNGRGRHTMLRNAYSNAVGDLVWYATNRGQQHVTPKLRRRFEGPFPVVGRVSDLLYRVQLKPKETGTLIHHDKLKPYLGTSAPSWVVRASRKARK